MACYTVKTKDGIFGSLDLAALIENKGAFTLLSSASRGEIPASSIFDKLIFPMSKSDVDRYKDVQCFDVDAQLRDLREPSENDAVYKVRVGTVFEYEGERIARFPDVNINNKYNKRQRMAVVRIGNVLYVVLGKARKDTVSGIVIVEG